jgi:hypothetical protein
MHPVLFSSPVVEGQEYITTHKEIHRFNMMQIDGYYWISQTSVCKGSKLIAEDETND